MYKIDEFYSFDDDSLVMIYFDTGEFTDFKCNESTKIWDYCY